MNRILVLEGYTNPFGDSRRKSQQLGGTMRRRRSYRGIKQMQSKMKSCAAEWRASSKSGKYTRFMAACLKR